MLWMSNFVPASLTGIIVIVLFSVLDVLNFEEAAMGLGNPAIWLVISVLILSIAVEEYRFDMRIAFSLLTLAKGNKKFILLVLIFIAFILAFIIPNAFARLTILYSIAEGILKSNSEHKDSNFTKACMLTVTYAPYIVIITVFTASGDRKSVV